MMQFYVMSLLNDKLKSLAPILTKLMQILTPRDLSQMAVGQCKYSYNQ